MAAVAQKRVPFLFTYRSSVVFIIITVAFAVFTDAFLYGVIVPVIPFALESRVGIVEGKVQFWVSILLAVYGAALVVSSPLWGYLADRISSRRLPMVVGLLLLGGATALLCAGTSIPLLIVGRILQGVSAALVWTVGLALIVDATSSENIGKAMGWVELAMSAGILSSPMLGGLVYSAGGYYSVFAMCFGLIAVDTAMRLTAIDTKTAEALLGEAETVTIALQAERHTHDEQTPDSTLQRGKANHKSAFLTLLRSPRLLAALWGTLVHGIILTSFDSTLPLFVSETFGWNSVGAGLIFLPLIFPSLLGPLVGAACDRWGAKLLSSIGFLVATPFLICIRFVDSDSLSQKAILCVLLIGVGIAMALVLSPLMAEITWVVEEVLPSSAQSSYAQAYGLFNMAFSAGALLGPIIGGMIRDAAGWGTVGWVLGLITFATFITQAIWLGGIGHGIEDEDNINSLIGHLSRTLLPAVQ